MCKRLKQWRIPCEQTINDVGDAIKRTIPNEAEILGHNKHMNDTLRDGSRATEQFYKRFHNYRSIESKLKEIAETDSRVTVETIGYSYQKRKLYLVKVSSDPGANKSVIFIDAGHHAREVSDI